MHNSMFQGTHTGQDKTIKKVSENYYFNNLMDYVTKYVKTCLVCQRIKDPKKTNWAPMGHIESLGPFDLVSIDIWSPGITSVQGNKCVLTVIDGFSKWAHAIPLPNHKGETVARALSKLFNTTFWPRRVHSDQGSEFKGDLMKEFTKLFGVEQSFTTAYHPQGNAYA